MRIARFASGDDVGFGLVESDGEGGEEYVSRLNGHPLIGDITVTGERAKLADVRLLSPVLPTKVVCIGKNYADHVAEMADVTGEATEEPVVFLKPSTSVCGPYDPVIHPSLSREVHYEGELALVVSRPCRQVPRERAKDVIFGYTVANDVTARDLQRKDKQWTRAKGFDTFCPLGPWITTGMGVEEAQNLTLTTELDGHSRQRGSTSNLIHDIPAIIEYVTSFMTLLPGDVVLTGTPAGVGPMEPGQEVAVTVDGLGTIRNRVVAQD
ncbi:fumarylacetoacetate hydrolase family protein [Nocardiopsis sp. LOL_012]|uniref:fumarylacetoacetate hydrolase family protein n=1 Tax=Nocardiopsis sp. LOL_012 TaxID=3345409 RepID=UPI003A8B39D6